MKLKEKRYVTFSSSISWKYDVWSLRNNPDLKRKWSRKRRKWSRKRNNWKEMGRLINQNILRSSLTQAALSGPIKKLLHAIKPRRNCGRNCWKTHHLTVNESLMFQQMAPWFLNTFYALEKEGKKSDKNNPQTQLH